MEKKNKIGAQLRQFFDAEGITQKEVAQALGVTPQYVNGICAGRNVIGKTIADKLAKYYGLSKSWLLTGEGDMLSKAKDTPENEGLELPLIPVAAMAGALTSGSPAIMEYDCERYIVPAFHGADFLIRVQGDSMEPRYFPGDIVACQRVELDRLWFQWGKVYVLDTCQGALIKRIEPSEKEGCVSIHSANAAYKPFDLPVSEINGVALVRGVIRVE